MPKFNPSTPKCRKRLQRASYVAETIERDIRQALRQVGFTAEVGYPLDFTAATESNGATAPAVDLANRDRRGSLPAYSTLTDHDALDVHGWRISNSDSPSQQVSLLTNRVDEATKAITDDVPFIRFERIDRLATDLRSTVVG